jgi:hypothetical protein
VVEQPGGYADGPGLTAAPAEAVPRLIGHPAGPSAEVLRSHPGGWSDLRP